MVFTMQKNPYTIAAGEKQGEKRNGTHEDNGSIPKKATKASVIGPDAQGHYVQLRPCSLPAWQNLLSHVMLFVLCLACWYRVALEVSKSNPCVANTPVHISAWFF